MPKQKSAPTIDPNDYEPLFDYILLKPEIEAERSEGGIYIPEQARRNLNEGQITKLGPDCPANLKVGMFVTFAGSSEYKLDIGKGEIVFCVKATNLILAREDKSVAKRLFPTQVPVEGAFFRCSRHGYVGAVSCPTCVADYKRSISNTR